MKARRPTGVPQRVTSLVIGLAVVAVVRTARAQASPPGVVTAFTHVAVIPMDRERVLRDQTALVRGNQIIALGPAATIRVPAGAVLIDGRGKFLSPGLANMHAHADPGYAPGYTGEDSLDSRDSVRSAAQREWVLLSYLAVGITTIRQMDGQPWHLALRERVARGELVGPRIYTAGPALHVPTPAAAVQAVTEQHAAGYDFLKLKSVNDVATFDSLVAAAARAHMPLGGHTPGGAVGIERMLHAHVASIEHLYGYLDYVVTGDSTIPAQVRSRKGQVDDAKIRAIARATREAGVWNCPTLLLANGMLGAQVGGKVIKALHDAGAGLLLGTDGGPYETRAVLAMELQALVEAGLTPYQVLETGTRNVAQFFGTLDSTGTVAVGKRADLVLLARNPLKNVRDAAQPVGVMVGGRWLARADVEGRLQALERMLHPTGAPAP